MLRRFLLPAACLGVVFAEEAPEIDREGPEFVLISDTESTKFTASGGETDPPSELGDGPWIRTGRRKYIWHIDVTDPVPGEMENPHPLDGTITTSETFLVPCDKPGGYSISVALQEEWQDVSNPLTVLFWPLADGEAMPPLPLASQDPLAPQLPPAPQISVASFMPAFPIVPPFVAEGGEKK
jgi:hypothetical protein